MQACLLAHDVCMQHVACAREQDTQPVVVIAIGFLMPLAFVVIEAILPCTMCDYDHC